MIAGRIVYDADCGFCTRSARWIDHDPVAWQALDLSAVGATAEQAEGFVGWLVDGRIRSLGSVAIADALLAAGGWRTLAGRVLRLPGVRRLAAALYPVLARNRHRLPGGTEACRLDEQHRGG